MKKNIVINFSYVLAEISWNAPGLASGGIECPPPQESFWPVTTETGHLDMFYIEKIAI